MFISFHCSVFIRINYLKMLIYLGDFSLRKGISRFSNNTGVYKKSTHTHMRTRTRISAQTRIHKYSQIRTLIII